MIGDDAIKLLVVSMAVFVGVVCLLRLSLMIFPNRTYDVNFTSRSLTGWTNTPKKLAWASLIEQVAEQDNR